MVELHGRDELLGSLFDESLPVAVHIQDDTMLIVPAHGLSDHEPDVGPILAPVLQTSGVARVGEIAVGVGVDVGEDYPQGSVVHFILKIPLLPVGPGAEGAYLIGAQGAGGPVAGDIHLLVEHEGQAHVVDGVAGGAVSR